MLYYDSENNEYITTEELKKEFEELKANEDTEAKTFKEYLSNCMYYNNGTLEEVRWIQYFKEVREVIRLYLSITHSQMAELKDHLYYNGYHVDWETDDVISVDEDEAAYVKTILHDRGIGFSE